jgi:hypothetical protein
MLTYGPICKSTVTNSSRNAPRPACLTAIQHEHRAGHIIRYFLNGSGIGLKLRPVHLQVHVSLLLYFLTLGAVGRPSPRRA